MLDGHCGLLMCAPHNRVAHPTITRTYLCCLSSVCQTLTAFLELYGMFLNDRDSCSVYQNTVLFFLLLAITSLSHLTLPVTHTHTHIYIWGPR